MTIEKSTDIQPRRHGFQPGKSGNPAGKPRGTKSKSTQLMNALFGKNPQDLRDIVAKTIECAKAGKPWAAELILARLWPVPNGRPVQIDIPTGLGLGGIAAMFDSIFQNVAEGRITISEATELGKLLQMQAQVLEQSEIERRLRALEDAEMKRAA
jgi:hypothetical protein